LQKCANRWTDNKKGVVFLSVFYYIFLGNHRHFRQSSQSSSGVEQRSRKA
jgi:hypothetical protein